jgi:hypothetical protein
MKPSIFRLLSPVLVGGMAAAVAGPALADEPSLQPAHRLVVAAIGGPSRAIALTDSEMGELRGAGFLSALLAGLPTQNTVQYQITTGPPPDPVSSSGPGTQTLSVSTPTIQVSLLATNEATPPPIGVTKTFTTTITRSFSKSYSFSF